MTTPMMQQWQAVKGRHGDGILFFRMGDFFEFFHDDAKQAARLLGLTLTSRSKGEGSIPMAGIPVRAADGYVQRLVEMGERVVICDQVQDPSEANGIVDRQVTRIVTPGTIVEGDALDDKDNNYLAAVSYGDGRCGVSWVDLSTGVFVTRDVAVGEEHDLLQRIEAAECLVSEADAAAGGPGEHLAPLLDASITMRPEFCFDRDSAARNLNRHFGTRSLDGFGVDESEAELGAAGAILDYLEETQCGSVGQIRAIRVEHGGDTMALDRTTRSSLELVRTLRDGDRRGSLLGVMDRTVTAMGARMLKGWIVSPLLSVDAIRARQDAVEELADDGDRLRELRRALGDVLDMERLAARVGSGRASPRDLHALRQSLGILPAVVATLEEPAATLLREAEEEMPDLGAVARLLESALVDEPPLTITEGGIVRDGYSAELDDLRRIGGEGKSFIASFQQRETERTGIPNLKIGFNKVFGYYIEVTNSHKDRVPEDWQRKQTLKNAERYITPELKEYEDKVLHAEDRSKRLEHELFGELRSACEARLDDLQRAAAVVARLDALHSLAKLARDEGWVRPEITDEPVLEIEEGCHPVVVKRCAGEPFVPNDVDLDDARRLMLITGPNMAGKSTYIRQVAIIVLMAQLGSFVPSRRARIGVVDQVFTRVGASDDLARGSSTFMVEMLEVANILNNASPRSLVILDEVGRGTSTFDGLSLAWAITEHLARTTCCKALFATHYHELTEAADRLDCVVNFNVAVREWGEEIVFLHKIVAGSADKSYGIHVARLAGLPATVLERARQVLGQLETQEPPAVAEPAPEAVPEAAQLSLFTAPDPLREALAAIDVNAITPIEALNLLAKLKAGPGA